MGGWDEVARLLVEKAGILGAFLALLLVSAAAAGGTMVGQVLVIRSLARSLTQFGKQLESTSTQLGEVVTQLRTQHDVHVGFATSQREQTEDFKRLTVELTALSRAIHEADIRRSEQLTQLITTLITRGQ